MIDWIQKGKRVVCIRDMYIPFSNNVKLIVPQKNKIYIIRDFVSEDNIYFGKTIGLFFEEIVNPLVRGLEPAFVYNCFKPLDETKIDVFRQHLNTIPKEDKVLETV